ncbi:hypothetical protein ABID08_006317 [Rhizobium binae]|uniref:Uncharacterized protein n=1 Tax=Rhizobium binae TaxID=1138190 RepID=A0ABV2MR41_9HYPH
MAECALQSGIPAVATSEHKLGKQPWDALIENGTIVSASLVTESAS